MEFRRVLIRSSLDYPSLEDYPVVRSSGVRKHRLVATGSADIPGGFILSGKFQIMSPPYLKAFINTGGVNPSRDVISNKADSNGNRWGFSQMDIRTEERSEGKECVRTCKY